MVGLGFKDNKKKWTTTTLSREAFNFGPYPKQKWISNYLSEIA